MSGLTRTDLATSRKVERAAMAVARQEQHGSVTELSGAFGVSQETVYSAREQGRRMSSPRWLPSVNYIDPSATITLTHPVVAVLGLRRKLSDHQGQGAGVYRRESLAISRDLVRADAGIVLRRGPTDDDRRLADRAKCERVAVEGWRRHVQWRLGRDGRRRGRRLRCAAGYEQGHCTTHASHVRSPGRCPSA
jgi:hypothetical protein